MKASRASLLKGSGEVMADGATVVSAVDMAVDAAWPEGVEAVEAEAEPDGPAAETAVPDTVESAVEPAPEPAAEVAFDEAVNIVEFCYRVEGDIQFLDVSFGFWI
jgi:hypothetical protein